MGGGIKRLSDCETSGVEGLGKRKASRESRMEYLVLVGYGE